jgi:hypothetical protein
MNQKLYPHLTVTVDTEPFYHDLVRRYTSLGSGRNRDRLDIRKEIAQRCEGMDQWLVNHGYQCGRDYQQTGTGYRFASEPLATFFCLAWS